MSSRKLGLSLVLALMFVFGAWASAFGDTIWVATDGNDTTGDGSEGSPYATIQKGIDEASNEDTVKVKNGTYTGSGNVNLHFDGKAVTLKSENGPENCIIDCGGEYTNNDGFRIEDGEGRSTVIDGFTVRNAGVSEGHHGVYINGASPTITNCIITHNQGVTMSSHYGAGIRAESGSPKIVNCIVKENSTTQGYSGGGGMYIKNCTGAEIINCLVANNKCNQGGGGGIRIFGGTVTIKNCTVVNNDQINGSQGGVYCRGNSVVTLYNTIIWGNKGTQVSVQSGSTAELYNCDCQEGWSGTGSGNIDSDPLFVDAGSLGLGGYGDYHLQSTSPCIDAGDNLHVTESTDLDGNPRIIDGNSPPDGTDTVDMGSYEYTPPTVTITTTALDDGDEDQYYSFTVEAVSGVEPYIWSATSLPDGLSINSETGEISGIPTVEGDFIVSVTVTDANSESDNKDFPLKIWSATLTIITESLPDGIEGEPYGATVEARGGTQPYIWSATGLPAGLTIDEDSGEISGTLPTEDEFSVSVTVTDAVYDTDSRNYVLTVLGGNVIYVDATDGNDINDGLSPANAVKTIQKGLDRAIENGGDDWKVLVGDGTYNETGLDFQGYAIHLKSVSGAENCIIDGQSSGRVFYFHSGETNESILQGFTIQNGKLTGTSGVPTNCGAGICCYGGAPTVINCIIRNNVSGYRAGGVYSQDPVKIINCLIVNNQGKYGGGLTFRSGANGAELINCTVAYNNGTSKGGGAYVRDSGVSISLANCIVWGNTSPDGPQFYLYSDATLTVVYSDVEGGYAGTGNIGVDPRFVDVENGDYHLGTSPCVDSGNNSYVEVTKDLEGNPRVVWETVDIGAYEYTGEPNIKPDPPSADDIIYWNEYDEGGNPVFNPVNPTPGFILVRMSGLPGDEPETFEFCQVQVSWTQDFATEDIVWDSGKVAFPSSLSEGELWPEEFLRYAGKPLESEGTIYIRIKVWDDWDAQSDWSDPALVEFSAFDGSYFSSQPLSIRWGLIPWDLDSPGTVSLPVNTTVNVYYHLSGWVNRPYDSATVVNLIDMHTETQLNGELGEVQSQVNIVGPYPDIGGNPSGYWYWFDTTVKVCYYCTSVGTDNISLTTFFKEGFNTIPFPGDNEVAVPWTTSGQDPFGYPDPTMYDWLVCQNFAIVDTSETVYSNAEATCNLDIYKYGDTEKVLEEEDHVDKQGGIVVWNGDYDANKTGRDHTIKEQYQNEDDLVKIKLIIPEETQGAIKLSLKSGKDHICVWKSKTKGAEPLLEDKTNKDSKTWASLAAMKNDLTNEELWVEGVKKSDSMTDVTIELEAGGNADCVKLTVLWVVISGKFSTTQSVSSDNEAKAIYEIFTVPSRNTLGPGQFFNITGWACELKGTVYPTDFKRLHKIIDRDGNETIEHIPFLLDRDKNSRVYVDQTNGSTEVGEEITFSSPPPLTTGGPDEGNDTSSKSLRDDDPQSGNSKAIYDLDAPGIGLIEAIRNTIGRRRANYKEFARIEWGEWRKCSDFFEWYTAQSWKLTGDAEENTPSENLGTNTLKRAGANWTQDEWKDGSVVVVAIIGGRARKIGARVTGNTADTLTVNRTWPVVVRNKEIITAYFITKKDAWVPEGTFNAKGDNKTMAGKLPKLTWNLE